MADSKTDSRITLGFIIGGLVNLGTTLTFVIPNHLGKLYPMVFSLFGIIAIILWGLAYISVSKSYAKVRMLLLVFAVEKAVYVGAWIYWLAKQRTILDEPGVVSNGFDKFFLNGFGVVDFAWGVFFVWVFITTGKKQPTDD